MDVVKSEYVPMGHVGGAALKHLPDDGTSYMKLIISVHPENDLRKLRTSCIIQMNIISSDENPRIYFSVLQQRR